MPKRRYDDDALRQRALELRSRGLSYREIARELGCSVFKVHQLISPYESPRSRVRQVHELTSRVEELSKKLRDLGVLASRLEVAVKPPAFNIGSDLELLCRNVMEARMTYRPCIHMDPDGYCTGHFVFTSERLEGIDCRRGVIRGVGDVEVCYPSVLTHWFLCLLCPYYTPAEGEEAERILGDRWAECVNGRLVLRGPEESNPNVQQAYQDARV